jgi:hypothetical protein
MTPKTGHDGSVALLHKEGRTKTETKKTGTEKESGDREKKAGTGTFTVPAFNLSSYLSLLSQSSLH